jgi:hypothetical protein
MRIAALTLIALLAGTSLASAEARRSIVGRWGVTPAECATTAAFGIEAQSIVTDDMSCQLPGVSRVGDVVTFTGTCDNAGGKAGPKTVVATLRGERLDLAFAKGGGRYAGLHRCRAGR